MRTLKVIAGMKPCPHLFLTACHVDGGLSLCTWCVDPFRVCCGRCMRTYSAKSLTKNKCRDLRGECSSDTVIQCYAALVLLSPPAMKIRASEQRYRCASSPSEPKDLPRLEETEAEVDLSIVIPAYNEVPRLPSMLKQAVEHLSSHYSRGRFRGRRSIFRWLHDQQSYSRFW